MTTSSIRDLANLPSVDRLLTSPDGKNLVATHGRVAVTAALRAALDTCRNELRQGHAILDPTACVISRADAALQRAARPSLRAVINLTGTILHTNLGRAFLPEDAIDAVADVARGGSNLEYDLEAGRRGDRDSHVAEQICRLTGAETATVVNNNAAAVMLVLNTLAMGKEVPVSRGELVEIGGAFRIPDIMARSGCRLVEVGTTNRTHLADFERAISPETAMIMKVHTSNYVIEGFTAAVPEAQLAALCRQADIPFVNDLGSGTLADLAAFGLPHEPTPMDALKNGADLVTFSGDKLLGGPQAGLIAGRKDLIETINANPMKRAMRCDKMTIAALSTVLAHYRDPDRLVERLPVLRVLVRTQDNIRAQAEQILPHVRRALADSAQASAVACDSEIGSGALPTRTLASYGIGIRPAAGTAREGSALDRISAGFRQLPTPVIGRIEAGVFVLDLRCLLDEPAFIAQLSAWRLPAA